VSPTVFGNPAQKPRKVAICTALLVWLAPQRAWPRRKFADARMIKRQDRQIVATVEAIHQRLCPVVKDNPSRCQTHDHNDMGLLLP
jgi:hypothetical protein